MSGSWPLKRFLKKVLDVVGLELHRVPRDGHRDRSSVSGALDQVRRLDWQPRACIDVGAAFGDFTVACARVFRSARYLLVEPLEEYKVFLDKVVAELPEAYYSMVAAAAHSGSTEIHVHRDLVGSSLFGEAEGVQVDGFKRTVHAATLDQLCYAHQITGPYLIKIDVQGAELEVLKGAGEVLRNTEYLILETSLFRFFIGGPQFDAVVEFMKSKGFVPYDILGLSYRPFDGALAQVDVAFVQEAGIFRRHHIYATPQQRTAQDGDFVEIAHQRRRELRRRQRVRARAGM